MEDVIHWNNTLKGGVDMADKESNNDILSRNERDLAFTIIFNAQRELVCKA